MLYEKRCSQKTENMKPESIREEKPENVQFKGVTEEKMTSQSTKKIDPRDCVIPGTVSLTMRMLRGRTDVTT